MTTITVAQLQERLDKVRTAIDKILDNGQNVTYEGRSVGFADLKSLEDLEARLERRIARKQNSGLAVSRGVPV